jgi:hypothetical protein
MPTCQHCHREIRRGADGRWLNVFDWDDGRPICWPCARRLNYRWIGLTLFGGDRWVHDPEPDVAEGTS